MIPDRSWREHAACTTTPTRLFFSGRTEHITQALEVCAGCTVRSLCLDEALRDPYTSGVWGGTTEIERHELRRAAGHRGRYRPLPENLDDLDRPKTVTPSPDCAVTHCARAGIHDGLCRQHRITQLADHRKDTTT